MTKTTLRYGYDLEAICELTKSGLPTSTCPCYTCAEMRPIFADIEATKVYVARMAAFEGAK